MDQNCTRNSKGRECHGIGSSMLRHSENTRSRYNSILERIEKQKLLAIPALLHATANDDMHYLWQIYTRTQF